MKTLNTDTLQELQQRLHRLGPDSRAGWGRMNAHQMVCHLNDALGFAMGQKSASENVTFVGRTLMRWFALRVPLPWPKGVPTRPECDQLVAGTPPVDFLRDTAALRSALERFARAPRDFQFARHPIFGALTEWEWMRWAYLHADHHLRQFGL